MKHNLDLIDWIIANTENTDTIKAEDAARWFVAMQEAKLVFESYTNKDLAHMIQHGFGPIDDEYVTGWLSNSAENWDDPDLTWEESLIGLLTIHFGIDS